MPLAAANWPTLAADYLKFTRQHPQLATASVGEKRKRGHFFPTGFAPARPKIAQQRLSAKVFEQKRVA
jgi:hypothetical protein